MLYLGLMSQKKTTTKPNKKSAATAKKASKKNQSKAKETKQTQKTATQATTGDFLTDNTIFKLSIDKKKVQQAWDKALQQARQQLKNDGFRQGKAPVSMVEKKLGQGYLVQKTAELILPEAYSAYLQKNDLRPLTEPQIKPVQVEPDQDWEFEVEIATYPEIKLGDYQKVGQQATAQWEKEQSKKSKDAAKKEDNQKNQPAIDPQQEKMQIILAALLDEIEVKVPELLLRKETEVQIQQLQHQLQHMNMEFDDFLKKSGKSYEDVQRDYAVRALGNLRVELLLGAIIRDAKLEVTEKEVTAALQERLDKIPQGERPEIKPTDIEYMHSLLLKQKALDHIANL